MRKTSINPTKWLSFGRFLHSPGVNKKYGGAFGRSICGKETASGNHFKNVEKTESRNQRVEHIIDFTLR